MNENKAKSIDEIIAMYNEKYNDTFSYLSGGYALWNDDYDEFFLAAANLDNAAVNIRVYSSGNVYDNYVEVKYKKDIEQKVSALAETIYGDCVVINCPASFGSGIFSADTTFEEYANSEYANSRTAILVNKSPENEETDIRILRDLLAENKLLTEIRIR